jgi:broad specificity phosphatase PhoE
MKTSLLTAALILLTALTPPAYSQVERIIYLVRHAEKLIDDSKDPSLTTIGKQRANYLSKMLKGKNITAIYSSDFNRTRQTAQPLAKRLGLNITLYNPGKLNQFAKQLLASQGNLLVVGHSNTTPDLALLLGGEAFAVIDHLEYDRVYQLSFQSGQIKTMLLHSKPVQLKNIELK